MDKNEIKQLEDIKVQIDKDIEYIRKGGLPEYLDTYGLNI